MLRRCKKKGLDILSPSSSGRFFFPFHLTFVFVSFFVPLWRRRRGVAGRSTSLSGRLVAHRASPLFLSSSARKGEKRGWKPENRGGTEREKLRAHQRPARKKLARSISLGRPDEKKNAFSTRARTEFPSLSRPARPATHAMRSTGIVRGSSAARKRGDPRWKRRQRRTLFPPFFLSRNRLLDVDVESKRAQQRQRATPLSPLCCASKPPVARACAPRAVTGEFCTRPRGECEFAAS